VKIKLDENLPLALQNGLAARGHDVHSVFDENLAGEPDERIWEACTAEERFLITQDLDFSDARKYPPGTHPGIMILRLVDDSRENLIRVVLQAFTEQDIGSFERALVVVSDVKIRIRRS
jgi:predicted nuclease of predicted toxin-antitoxin system